MLSELVSMLNRYQFRRATLYKDISNLCTEALDWKVAEKSTTIGTLLLHIAGVEDLAISSMKGIDIDQRWREPHWSRLVPGFAIELNRERVSGFGVEYYIGILQEIESETVRYFQDLNQESLEKESPFYLEGKNLQPGCFEMLQNRSLLMSILQHEQYHRGQIMLLKFLFSDQGK